MTLSIYKEGETYNFGVNLSSDSGEICDELYIRTPDEFCMYCGRHLDCAYVFIIKKLQKKGLISPHYCLKCCHCNMRWNR